MDGYDDKVEIVTEVEMAGLKLVRSFSLGNIEAVIFDKQTDDDQFEYIIQIRRDGVDLDSFGTDDLMLVSKVLDMSHTWIFERQ